MVRGDGYSFVLFPVVSFSMLIWGLDMQSLDISCDNKYRTPYSVQSVLPIIGDFHAPLLIACKVPIVRHLHRHMQDKRTPIQTETIPHTPYKIQHNHTLTDPTQQKSMGVWFSFRPMWVPFGLELSVETSNGSLYNQIYP